MRRLRGTVRSEWALFGRGAVVGRVGDSSFSMRKRLPAFFHNSFQTQVTCRMESEGGATRLHARFGLHFFAAVLMAIWFGFLAATMLISIAFSLDHGTTSIPAFFISLAPVAAMLLLLSGIVAFCRFLARNDRQFLLDFLKDTIQAREIPERADATVERGA